MQRSSSSERVQSGSAGGSSIGRKRERGASTRLPGHLQLNTGAVDDLEDVSSADEGRSSEDEDESKAGGGVGHAWRRTQRRGGELTGDEAVASLRERL